MEGKNNIGWARLMTIVDRASMNFVGGRFVGVGIVACDDVSREVAVVEGAEFVCVVYMRLSTPSHAKLFLGP